LNGRLRSLGEHAACLQALRVDPITAGQLDVLVGTSSMLMRLDADTILGRLLTEVVGTAPDLDWHGDVFDRAYRRLESFLYAVDLDSVLLAPLRGVTALPAPIRLGEGIELDRMSDTEIPAAIGLGFIETMGRRAAHVDQPYAIRIRRRASKVVVRDPESQERLADAASHVEATERLHQHAERVVEALRLLKSGQVAIRGFLRFEDNWLLEGGWSHSLLLSLPATAGPTYELTSSEADELRGVWRRLGEGAIGEKPIAPARRRFVFAGDRSRDDDRLVDLMIAAESLFLSDAGRASERTELGFRLRLRAASFLSTPKWTSRQLFTQFGRAYRVRSAIVHGGEPDAKDVRSPSGEQVQLRDFVDLFEDLMRLALKQSMGAAVTKGFPPDWLELVLPDSESRPGSREDP
jgi:hypothetical protein